MKRLSTLVLSVILLLSLSPGVQAAEPEPLMDPGISIRINGTIRQPVNVDGEPVYPIVYDGTTYVPVRGVSYLFNKTVGWDQDSRSVLITDKPVIAPVLKTAEKPAPSALPGVRPDEGISIKYNGETRVMTDVNGKAVYPIQYNGTVYIPVRGAAGLFDRQVSWDESTRSVMINDIMKDVTPEDVVAGIKIGTNHARSLSMVDYTYKIGYQEYPAPIDGLSKVSYLTLWMEGLTPYIPAQLIGSGRVDQEFYDLQKFTRVIQEFKAAGYDAVRLPVSWTLWTNDTTFVIDREWLDFVEDAVKIVLDNGMYCIINAMDDYIDRSWVGDHWAGNWMDDEYREYVDARFAAIWSQVAEHFKYYGEHLIFEAMNEPVDGDDVNQQKGWDRRIREGIARVDELNELFVKTIRAAGGNNAERILSIEPYCLAMEARHGHYLEMKIPDDDKLIVQVHYYFHYNDYSPVTSWSRTNPADTKQIDETFALIKQFKDKTGAAMILGEFANAESLSVPERIDQATYILEKATELGIPGFWWEPTINIPKNDGKAKAFSLFDRDKMEWIYPEILDAMMNVVNK